MPGKGRTLMTNFAILTDSCSDLTAPLRERFGVDGYVPGALVYPDGSNHYADLDWKNMTPAQFFGTMKDKKGGGIRIWLRCLNCPRIGCAGLIRWLCGTISSSIAINAAEPKTVIVPFVGKRSLYPGIHITIRKDAVPAADIPLYSKPWGAPGIFGQKRTMLI